MSDTLPKQPLGFKVTTESSQEYADYLEEVDRILDEAETVTAFLNDPEVPTFSSDDPNYYVELQTYLEELNTCLWDIKNLESDYEVITRGVKASVMPIFKQEDRLNRATTALAEVHYSILFFRSIYDYVEAVYNCHDYLEQMNHGVFATLEREERIDILKFWKQNIESIFHSSYQAPVFFQDIAKSFLEKTNYENLSTKVLQKIESLAELYSISTELEQTELLSQQLESIGIVLGKSHEPFAIDHIIGQQESYVELLEGGVQLILTIETDYGFHVITGEFDEQWEKSEMSYPQFYNFCENTLLTKPGLIILKNENKTRFTVVLNNVQYYEGKNIGAQSIVHANPIISILN
jgi:hypothetical protein